MFPTGLTQTGSEFHRVGVATEQTLTSVFITNVGPKPTTDLEDRSYFLQERAVTVNYAGGLDENTCYVIVQILIQLLLLLIIGIYMAPESTLNKMLSTFYVQLHKLYMYYVAKKLCKTLSQVVWWRVDASLHCHARLPRGTPSLLCPERRQTPPTGRRRQGLD